MSCLVASAERFTVVAMVRLLEKKSVQAVVYAVNQIPPAAGSILVLPLALEVTDNSSRSEATGLHETFSVVIPKRGSIARGICWFYLAGSRFLADKTGSE